MLVNMMVACGHLTEQGCNIMAEIVQGLFGVSPESLNAQREQALQSQALQYAQLDPNQQAQMGFYQAGSRLGTGLAGMMGAQDPEMQRVTQRQQMLKSINPNDPESLKQGIQAAMQGGDYQLASTLNSQYQAAAKAAQGTQQAQAELRKTTAEAGGIEYKAAQDVKLRDALSALGSNPTQEQIVSVVAQYGSPDKVLAVVQGASDKEAARAQALEVAKTAAEAKVEAAREAGANRLEIARIQAESRTQLAQLAAALKGPSAAEIKRQDVVDKAAEGKASLGETLGVASKLVEDLGKSGGMSSTASSGLSNLLTKLQTSSTGQYLGQTFGTENQKNRDVLASTRLQLFNDVKTATGMSASQLNSNVELQTWLNSLGSPGMTKEANQDILNNISNKYLKKPINKAAGTKDDPIVLK